MVGSTSLGPGCTTRCPATVARPRAALTRSAALTLRVSEQVSEQVSTTIVIGQESAVFNIVYVKVYFLLSQVAFEAILAFVMEIRIEVRDVAGTHNLAVAE